MPATIYYILNSGNTNMSEKNDNLACMPIYVLYVGIEYIVCSNPFIGWPYKSVGNWFCVVFLFFQSETGRWYSVMGRFLAISQKYFQVLKGITISEKN